MRAASPVDAFDAPAPPSIGTMLVSEGRLSAEAAESVLRYQRTHDLPFGEAAIQLGLVTKADVEQVIARQFDYPYLTPGESTVSDLIVAAYSPFDPRVEAFRAIRTQVLLRLDGGERRRRRISIVSSNPGDGRSVLAANLAVVFSQLGEKTLLIDADLRRPVQHKLFGIENRVGLSTILSGRASLDAIQRIPDFVDLSVLTAGALPPNPQELLNKDSFLQLLNGLGGEYDMILVDTPAASTHADALTISHRVGQSLVIARQNHSRLAGVRELAQWLGQARVQILGSILNAF